jgi:hypothetical protein
MAVFLRVWRGEVTLWKTYWLFGACGGILLGLPIFGALLALTDVPDNTTATFFIIAIGFLLLYGIWVFVGVWRAANNYQGKRAWAILAKVSIVIEALKIFNMIASVLLAGTG